MNGIDVAAGGVLGLALTIIFYWLKGLLMQRETRQWVDQVNVWKSTTTTTTTTSPIAEDESA